MPRALDLSPPAYTGPLHPLDKDAFKKRVPVIALRVPPRNVGTIVNAKELKNYIIRVPRLSPVVPDPHNPQGRLLILTISDQSELSDAAKERIQRDAEGFVDHEINLDYGFWSASDILDVCLPSELIEGAPKGFSSAGHLAHFNLNDEYLPYKHLIGSVFMDKNPQVKTVVNKLHNIDTVFRFFQMELIAGEPDFIVTHSESNCKFTFDFSKVYWNSRLHAEHERIVKSLSPHDVLADVFAGVGPFALPAAKVGCGVLANDLNPESVKYLAQNVQQNDLEDMVRVSCEDGRAFIRNVFRRLLVEPFAPYTGPRQSKTQQRKQKKREGDVEVSPTAPPTLPPRRRVTDLVMNLPDSAIEFLDAFPGVLSDPELSELYTTMPMVHCHCFTREMEEDKAHEDILQRVEARLGARPEEVREIHHVRSVAPGKEMYCISFRLPEKVARRT
ncbi:guanine-N(1)--methyltransferase [Cylindrobasidium torrendii FP15055 ss-10]|uniref:tRNA (guanine(37)-N1)-methyltransferase n=1 Tax=Cylindrobasidium torrendii FP15055 ss-10 TaxID=1314674 RepID=A0A0D7BTJ0_9AGAR|nr:guanine-N(1)--methyltransferase [Cylindrobasidium torrendii FP15055 ss-10]